MCIIRIHKCGDGGRRSHDLQAARISKHQEIHAFGVIHFDAEHLEQVCYRIILVKSADPRQRTGGSNGPGRDQVG